MEKRLRICRNLLQATGIEEELLNKTVTIDESWVYQYNPERKRQLSQWLGKHDSHPVKALHARATGKVLLVLFCNQKGMLHFKFFHGTINAEIFISILQCLRVSCKDWASSSSRTLFCTEHCITILCTDHQEFSAAIWNQSPQTNPLQSGLSPFRLLVFPLLEGAPHVMTISMHSKLLSGAELLTSHWTVFGNASVKSSPRDGPTV